jgi:UDP-sugar diphosphatase
LKEVKIISIKENINPKFIKTELITASREGTEFFWERVKSHDSVHILVDNTETKELLLVKQVRIPVLVNDAFNNGVCIEACAGLVDKNSNIIQITKEEVLEELGYDVYIEDIIFLKKLKSSVGSSGNTAWVFSCTVDESMKFSEGGGINDEDIEVFRLPYKDVYNFVTFGIENTDAMTQYLLYQWLFKNKI